MQVNNSMNNQNDEQELTDLRKRAGMGTLDAIEITSKDKQAYPYHTDSTIRGIKFIKSIPTAELHASLDAYKASKQIPYRDDLGSDTNPRWILGRIAEELYDRGVLDEEDFDTWNRLIG